MASSPLCLEFEIVTFGDDCILNKPIEEWAECDCLLAWHSDGCVTWVSEGQERTGEWGRSGTACWPGIQTGESVEGLRERTVCLVRSRVRGLVPWDVGTERVRGRCGMTADLAQCHGLRVEGAQGGGGRVRVAEAQGGGGSVRVEEAQGGGGCVRLLSSLKLLKLGPVGGPVPLAVA